MTDSKIPNFETAFVLEQLTKPEFTSIYLLGAITSKQHIGER